MSSEIRRRDARRSVDVAVDRTSRRKTGGEVGDEWSRDGRVGVGCWMSVEVGEEVLDGTAPEDREKTVKIDESQQSIEWV